VAAAPGAWRGPAGPSSGTRQHTNRTERPLGVFRATAWAIGFISLGVLGHGHPNLESMSTVLAAIIVSRHGLFANRIRESSYCTHTSNIKEPENEVQPSHASPGSLLSAHSPIQGSLEAQDSNDQKDVHPIEESPHATTAPLRF